MRCVGLVRIGRSTRVVTLIAAGMLTASGCTGESPDPSSSPTATTETAPDVVSAQDHLAVTESGFTVGENDNDDTTVTYAIILKNTHPTHAAIRIGIELTWTTGGEPIPVTDPEGPTTGHDPLWIPPGETTVLSDVITTETPPDDVTITYDTQPQANQWIPLADATGYGQLTIDDTSITDENDRQNPSWWEATIHITSTYPTQLEPVRLIAIYRDASGSILGGSKTHGDNTTSIPTGQSEHRLTTPADAIPPGTTTIDYAAHLTWTTNWWPTTP